MTMDRKDSFMRFCKGHNKGKAVLMCPIPGVKHKLIN